MVWETARDVQLQLGGLMRHMMRYGDSGVGAKFLVSDSHSDRVQTLPFKADIQRSRRLPIRQVLKILWVVWQAAVEVVRTRNAKAEL